MMSVYAASYSEVMRLAFRAPFPNEVLNRYLSACALLEIAVERIVACSELEVEPAVSSNI